MNEILSKISSYIQIKISILLLIMICGCCSTSTESGNYGQPEFLAKKKLGEGYKTKKNESGSFFLYYKKYADKNQLHSILNYFIYNVNKKEILFEEKIYDGEIKWFDENSIEIRITPEIISGDDDEIIYILNVLTKEKRKLNFTN